VWKPDYKAVAYLLLGIIIGCAGDNMIETLLARLV